MYRELHDLLTDPSHDRGTRLLRLQGWRGDQLCRATDAGLVARLAPAFCALGGLAVALVGSSALAAAVAVTAAIGVVAANHPVEWVANALAARGGRVPLPRNRAAKRLGCAIGTVLLVVAAVAFASGHTVAGVASAGVLAAVAG
ncbi:MAG: DUF4395 family protein [Microthrixaceae bacterium]|nr:DUF4395 family protein [Microthrixaceae bacterium]